MILPKENFLLRHKLSKTEKGICYDTPNNTATGKGGHHDRNHTGWTSDTKVKLPRNLRQIGNPSGEHKIYVEDFVYTFLHPSSREEAGNPKVAIIVGTQEEEHVRNTIRKRCFLHR